MRIPHGREWERPGVGILWGSALLMWSYAGTSSRRPSSPLINPDYHEPMPDESSAYPEPSDFEVMRPTYHEDDDGFVTAQITISPFSVEGESNTKAGARRAALYEARKTYASYHPGYDEENPFPEHFVDRQGTEWELLPPFERSTYGDYRFTDDLGEEDYVDIETMLMWDVRPDEIIEEKAEE